MDMAQGYPVTTVPAAAPKRRVAYTAALLLPADVWSIIKHFFFRNMWQARFTRCVLCNIPPPIFLRTQPGYRFFVIRSNDRFYLRWEMRRMWTDVEAVCVGTQHVFRVHQLPE
jgi:hypothetical protein